MIRGTTLFICTECKKVYLAPDVEYHAMAHSVPMPCERCGGMRTMPLRLSIFSKSDELNPDKPLEFKRNKTAVMEGKGLKLIDSPEGKKAKVVLIDYVDQPMPHEDSAILLNSDEKIEFTMMYDAAEGKYHIQVDTYPNGTEEAVVIKFPETITLV